ncbi:MAG TPA: hypothetical protein VFS67_04575 [Polyangiaceae bacterium]|nr:hypothetical protein [Polyangiaceae bacterium]
MRTRPTQEPGDGDGFILRPGCIGTDASGELPDGVRDRWVELDDIELY